MSSWRTSNTRSPLSHRSCLTSLCTPLALMRKGRQRRRRRRRREFKSGRSTGLPLGALPSSKSPTTHWPLWLALAVVVELSGVSLLSKMGGRLGSCLRLHLVQCTQRNGKVAVSAVFLKFLILYFFFFLQLVYDVMVITLNQKSAEECSDYDWTLLVS